MAAVERPLEGGRSLIKKSIVTALTLGFLAFTLSVLPVTTAEANCVVRENGCWPKEVIASIRGNVVTCCIVKDVARDEVFHACQRRGPRYRYDPKTNTCVNVQTKPMPQMPSGASQAACEANGHRWNPETGRCSKSLKKSRITQENPCGKGWYQAADGQCYPKLN
jgi:hypothetical protein